MRNINRYEFLQNRSGLTGCVFYLLSVRVDYKVLYGSIMLILFYFAIKIYLLLVLKGVNRLVS